MSTLDTILSFLQGKGLSSAQAAGVAGNFQVESGLDPAKPNPREGAIGLAQWEGGRRTALQNYARATGGSETDLSTQLGYLWTELSGPESGALTKLRATTDPGSAAAVFDQYFERSSGAARATRVAAAQAIAAGRPVTTGTDTGTAAAAGGVETASWFSHMLGADGWQAGVTTIALRTVAGATAAGLVIAGAIHTVSDK